MDLARELRRLDVDWPETPAFELEPAPRSRRSRRPLVAAVAVAVAALAAALAVPQSRGAILRFLHLGAATVQVVDTLPPAEQRPLESGIGPVVSIAAAKSKVTKLLLPPGVRPALHASGVAVSMVFTYEGEPVLLGEFAGGTFFKKLAAAGTRVEELRVGTAFGLWITGVEHDFFFPGASPRLAGNTLVWVDGDMTYRLEGRALTRDGALALARSLRIG